MGGKEKRSTKRVLAVEGGWVTVWPRHPPPRAEEQDGYAAGIDRAGARVSGRPAVDGCDGAGIPLSASRCAWARCPTTSSREPVTSTAYRTATTPMMATAATLATSTVVWPLWATANATNSRAENTTSRSCSARMRSSFDYAPDATAAWWRSVYSARGIRSGRRPYNSLRRKSSEARATSTIDSASEIRIGQRVESVVV